MRLRSAAAFSSAFLRRSCRNFLVFVDALTFCCSLLFSFLAAVLSELFFDAFPLFVDAFTFYCCLFFDALASDLEDGEAFVVVTKDLIEA